MQRASVLRQRVLILATVAIALAPVAAAVAYPLQPAPTAQLPEYDVKAAYLFNFAKFVEWPEDASPRTAAPLKLCVFGADSFGDALDSIEGKSIRDRRLTIERIRRTPQVDGCHILFIPRREFRLAESLLGAVAGKAVLTVTEAEEDNHPRGIINLVQRANRIVFQIAPQEAARSDLRISSRLLQLAEVYESEPHAGIR